MKACFFVCVLVAFAGCQKSDSTSEPADVEDGSSDLDDGTPDDGADAGADGEDDGGTDTATETGSPADTAPPTDTAMGDTASTDTATADTATADTATTDTASGDTGEIVADGDGDGFTTLTGDCDDADETIHPAAAELCDTLDNDCDGEIDEADSTDAGVWYADGDSDGFGDPAVSMTACAPPDEYVANSDDCDDDDNDIHPDGVEVCDAEDNDCDEFIDEDDALGAPTWYTDADGDGFGDAESTAVACTAPEDTVEDDTDCLDSDPAVHPEVEEACDTIDNDCDGEIDEGEATGSVTWYADYDVDGFGNPAVSVRACEAPVNFIADATDCDDADNDIHPGADEQCDGEDNDCDGDIDEDDAFGAVTWFVDADSDGFGDSSSGVVACAMPEGTVANGSDCNDANPVIHPDASEICDEQDNDCDGDTDELGAIDAVIWYTDGDGDGFGNASIPVLGCSAPEGSVGNDDDCDDSSVSVHPDADEACNGFDDDCDGDIDEDDAVDAVIWFADADGDAFGDSTTVTSACSVPAGYVADSTDCDDSEESTHPGADEYCDGVDNNCDESVDEDESVDVRTFYADGDGDGFGAPDATAAGCSAPPEYVDDSSDCDDDDSTAYPGATEFCDTVDNDCDGVIDPDDSADAGVWYLDADMDGFGDPLTAVMSCSAPAEAIADGDDCDDANPDVSPAGTETCNDIDDNCDGSVDEGADGECEFGSCIDGTCATDCEPGKQDLYFGDAGYVVYDMGGGEGLDDMTSDELGRIILTGTNGSANFETLRFTAMGEPDPSFGVDGRVSTSFPVYAASNAVDIDSEGRIVVAGSTHISCSETWNRYALARYLEDGSLDPSFGDGGTQTTNWGSVGTSLRDIEFQSDGKIVVSGNRYAGACSPGITNSTVTRYTADGHLDPSFGSGGEMRRDIPHGPHHDGNNALALGPDDSLWATGADGYWSWAGLQRYTSSGSFISEDAISTGYATAGGIEFNGIDRMIAATTDEVVQYGLDGIKIGWAGTSSSSYSVDTSPAPFESRASSLQLDDEGRILILSKSSTSFRVVRYRTDGTLDSSFGDDGIAEISSGYDHFQATAIARQPDGYIVVGGTVEVTPGDRDFALIRLCE